MVRRLVAKLGLAGEIDGRLELLKRHLPYFESDHVLSVAYNLGGACGWRTSTRFATTWPIWTPWERS